MAEPSAPPVISTGALGEMLARAQGPLIGFLRGLMADDEHARDLAQDVFVEAVRAARAGTSPFRVDHGEDEQRRWLFHVAYRRAISALRHRRVLRWESLDVAALPPLPADPTAFEDRVAEGMVVRAALASLAPEDAACLLLNTLQGYTAAEIAAITEASPEATKRRLSRAKQRLRAAYVSEQTRDQTKERNAHGR